MPRWESQMGSPRVELLSPQSWVPAEGVTGVMGNNYGWAKAIKEPGELRFDYINIGKLLDILEKILVHIYLLKSK